ncbi:hypothetical protein [Virgisporangium ochraceum]|uniref:TPR repeat-containing protein n=1 Tax=Virgisporangium ochraceum TaxID=65505 RepID=A0A8J4ECL8_9ACTN|nr:hypothetical protein [Virgisporangium ochraceum]GIJ70630.1 hypothetical protein Voc01_055470 [Virgisporangium ochraceum]
MTTSIDQVVHRLEAGESVEAIRRSSLPRALQRLLRACALAYVFTETQFESALRQHGGPDAPDLAALLADGLIEIAVDRPPLFRVPAVDRTAYVRAWLAGSGSDRSPEDVIALERRLAASWDGAGNRLETLRHLLLSDPDRAASMFESMFVEADGLRDFAWCQDLVDVLSDPDRTPSAGDDLAALGLDRKGYLRCRSYWAADYARSAQFLELPRFREHAEALLSGSGPRVWQMYAPGGAGKTTQLRWLIARYCVPRPRDVPCARIDFDVVDPVNAARHPWLLLLEIAGQIGRRLPPRTFGALDRYAPYRGLLSRRPSDLVRDVARSLDSLDLDAVEREVVETFVTRFDLALKKRPTLVVLDTTEELVLRGESGVAALLRMLGGVLARCQSLRLILAGRFDLREKAPGAWAELGAVRHVRVRRFTARQSDAYLGGLRGIGDADLRSAIVERAHGLPFALAAFADAVDLDPAFTADDARTSVEPNVRYLIERVVQRIDDRDVRWLLRYGVVPRRLRYDDVRSVIGLFLARGMRGPGEGDDPRTDRHYLSGGDEVFPFAGAPDGKRLRDAWHRLIAYAGRSSWVSRADDDGSSVTFLPEVLAPMRQLISARPVYVQLHRAFANHYENLAGGDPDLSLWYTREALYHRFQSADPLAYQLWHGAIGQARDSGRYDDVRALAEEVLGPEYLDGGRPRQGLLGRPLITDAIVAEAYGHLAYATFRSAQRENAGASDPLWTEVLHRLDHAEEIRRRSRNVPPATGREMAIRAAHARADGAAAEALEMLRSGVADAGVDERVDLLRILGDCQADTGDPAAVGTYGAAFTDAEASGRWDQCVDIALAAASERQRHGRLDEALRWCAAAEQTGDRIPGAPVMTLLSRAALLMRCYEPAAAKNVLRGLDGATVTQRAEAAVLTARADLLLGRANSALERLHEALDAAGRIPDLGRYRLLARIHQLRGVTYGELLALDEAEVSFQKATGLWRELGFLGGHPETAYLHVRFLIRDVGDLADASRKLAAMPEPVGDLRVRTALITRELAVARHEPVDPDDRLNGLSPVLSALAAAQRLTEPRSDVAADVDVLQTMVGQIQPPQARLVVLAELRRRADRAAPFAGLRSAFSGVLGADVDPDDGALHRSLLAELERLAGQPTAAHDALANARERLNVAMRRDRALAVWREMQARARLGEDIRPADVEVLDRSRPYRSPLLHAAGLLLVASSPSVDPEAARVMLLRAAHGARSVRRPSLWSARILQRYSEVTGDPAGRAEADRVFQVLGHPSYRGHGAHPPVLPDRADEARLLLRMPEELHALDLPATARELFRDWRAVAGAMREHLRPGRGWRRGITTLRLESSSAEVHAMPWELALDPGVDPVAYRCLPDAGEAYDVGWVQERLNRAFDAGLRADGVPGPRTMFALSKVQPDSGGSRPLVHAETRDRLGGVARRSRSGRPGVVIVGLGRGHGPGGSLSDGWGVDVAEPYERAGFAVRIAATADAFGTCAVPARPGSVLHISARLARTGGMPYFDLSGHGRAGRLASTSSGGDLHVKDIAAWLRGGDRAAPAPLVVLDPPFPGSPADVPGQLLLRNMFAALLFAEEVAPVILGTGLTVAGSWDVSRLMVEALSAGWPLASLVRRLRGARMSANTNWQTEPDRIAARATAVFAAPSAFA